MARVPFSKKVDEPAQRQKPQNKGNTAKEAPTGVEDGPKTGVHGTGGKGTRPGTVTPGTVRPADVVLPNVMHPTIEMDDHDFADGRRQRREGPSDYAKPFGRYAPDDPRIVSRLFGVDMGDID